MPRPFHSLTVAADQAGKPLAEVWTSHLRLPRQTILAAIAQGCRVAGKPCTDPRRRVQQGERLELSLTAPPGPVTRRPAPGSAPEEAPEIRIVFQDEHILVVDKPAGLTTVRHKDEEADRGKRAQRFLPATLVDRLGSMLRRRDRRIRAVHRLDKETSGLVVLALSQEAERQLGIQFRKHSIERRYHALVRGRAATETIESQLIEDRGDHRRGSDPAGAGRKAITHIRLIEALGEYSLVECRLETGRTHQVRIQLGERGTPLCGERLYDRPLHGRPLPDASNAPRPMLHAATLEIDHPITGKRHSWTSDPPRDFQHLLRTFRKRRGD